MRARNNWEYQWLPWINIEGVTVNPMQPEAGGVERGRVAYLLRAARSRQDKIERTNKGYKVGGTLLLEESR